MKRIIFTDLAADLRGIKCHSALDAESRGFFAYYTSGFLLEFTLMKMGAGMTKIVEILIHRSKALMNSFD